MVVIRGVNVYPSAVEEIVRAFPEVLEYRVQFKCRDAMAELALEVELSGQADAAATLPARIAAALQTALHLRMPVQAVPPGTLPRFEMKARRWVKAAE